jgi:hypothetical protein
MLRRVSQLLVAPLIAALVFVAVPVQAADHVVSGSDVSARLGEAAGVRQADIADIAAFLGSPVGQRAARVLGADTAKLQSRVSHLSDAEASDLARRARALTADPSSGLSSGAIVAIVLGGVALMVLMIVLLNKAYNDEGVYFY